jgi:hypothetical protein
MSERLFDPTLYTVSLPRHALVIDHGPPMVVAYAGGGDGDGYRFSGWFYGYAPCCVEAFVVRMGRYRAGLPIEEDPAHHPTRGYLLCQRCASGTPAPLPDRPADRMLVFWPGDEVNPSFMDGMGCSWSWWDWDPVNEDEDEDDGLPRLTRDQSWWWLQRVEAALRKARAAT